MSSRVRLGRVSRRKSSSFALGAGIAGIALIGALFLPWYSAASEGAIFNRSVGAAAGAFAFDYVHVTAWQAVTVDYAVFLAAGLSGIWLAVAVFAGLSTVAPIAIAPRIGLLGAILAVVRLVSPPDLSFGPTHRALGIWVGTVAAIALAVSGWFAERAERQAVSGLAGGLDLPAS